MKLDFARAATGLAMTAALQSQINVESVLNSIQTYATPGALSGAQHGALESTLHAPVADAPLLYNAPATPASPACTISNPYNAAAIAAIVQTCNSILVDGLTVPPGQTLDLGTTLPNTVITFDGRTSWEYEEKDYKLLTFSGTNLTVQGSSSHVIDGNGQLWWDGLGSNGGVTKPDHFIDISNVKGYAIFKNLYIKNPPTHNFYISHADSFYAFGNVIDVLDGNTVLLNGLPAAHNTDGWDMSTTTNVRGAIGFNSEYKLTNAQSLLTNNVVFNQDDCVALTSGSNVMFNNYYCDGGHGLSIGSVGGKLNNTVDGVTFSNSRVLNSQNGCRIKANSGTTGLINAVTYRNIELSNISIQGIDIQQDYLNGGPTGKPTPGVSITNIVMDNVQGVVAPSADNYYILVATPTTNASTWTFTNVDITGGANSSCNSVPQGFSCA